jgi:hypothetical protein
MNAKQLNEQVTNQIDRNIRELTEALIKRGSDFQSIYQRKDSVEIGVFPKTPGYDFYVLENVTVGMQNFSFPIQTTFFLSSTPTVKKGLWFPLKVRDEGEGKPCRLERISVRDGQQNFRPEVDLVTGDPPRVIIPRLIEVVDLSSEPEPPPPPPVQKEPVPVPQAREKNEGKKEEKKATEKEAKEKKETKPSKKESRRERRRRERRELREERRRERRYRRHHRRHHAENNQEVVRPAAEPPKKPNECTGDISVWKSMTCAIPGINDLIPPKPQ